MFTERRRSRSVRARRDFHVRCQVAPTSAQADLRRAEAEASERPSGWLKSSLSRPERVTNPAVFGDVFQTIRVIHDQRIDQTSLDLHPNRAYLDAASPSKHSDPHPHRAEDRPPVRFLSPSQSASCRPTARLST